MAINTELNIINESIQEKSFAFAIRIVNLRRFLMYDAPQKENIISKQLLRSGTSIGANIEEAQGGQSDTDFLSKISISYKEARETRYWIRLLAATNYINSTQANSLLSDIDEICRMLAKIIITTKKRIQEKS